MKLASNIVFLFLISGQIFANEYYWIYLRHKNTADMAQCWVSEQAVNQRINSGLDPLQFSDLPLNENFIQILEQLGLCIDSKSKWLNAVFVKMDTDQLSNIKQLRFIERIEKAGHLYIHNYNNEENEPDKDSRYQDVLVQIHAEEIIKQKYNGAGINIGVMDAGFKSLDNDPSLAHLIESKRIMAFRDFINPKNKDPFDAKASGMVNHGTRVLKNIAGKDVSQQYGMATEANFYLAYTDHDATEKRIEEAFWIAALEWFDSLGIKLVNSSLGYADGYDDPAENYLPENVDGKSTAITRAAQIAAKEKGMLIIVSAGNDGRKPFRVISLPADAESVLAVGATDYKTMLKLGFSSIGPAWLDYTKPDIACYSANGTSFSAPIITGLAACIMQAHPSLSNFQIIDLIKRSATLYPNGNNFIGYGVPDTRKILALLSNKEISACQTLKYSEVLDQSRTISSEKNTVIFHKTNASQVKQQVMLNASKNRTIIQLKPTDSSIARSTVASWQQCLEIIWNE